MLIEIISSNTIKVVLDEYDMAIYDISFDQLDRSSPETKRLLIDLIENINEEKNIDLSDERIFVEAFPKDDGGCLLYLSMLGTNIKVTPEKTSLYSSIICTVTDYAALQAICCNIFTMYSHITHNSELYFNDGSYYIILHTFKRADKKMRTFLSEYCEITGTGETDCSYIREYSQCLFPLNAIEEVTKKTTELS